MGNLVKSSYKVGDCIYLLGQLNDIDDVIVSKSVKESLIAYNKGNYGTILTKEDNVNIGVDEFKALMDSEFGDSYAKYVYRVYRQILNDLGDDVVLVSLMRGGTPLGVLLKRLLGENSIHYSISIIKDEHIGLDRVAMDHILYKHPDKKIVFVDSWVGQGSVLKTLIECMREYYKGVDYRIATLVDLDGTLSNYKATTEDVFILSSLLNSTISGLVSRSVCLGVDKLHEAYYYKEFEDIDLTNYFIDEMYKKVIKGNYKVKVGINESMRGILRRGVKELRVVECDEIKHLIDLANKLGVKVVIDNSLGKYKSLCVLG